MKKHVTFILGRGWRHRFKLSHPVFQELLVLSINLFECHFLTLGRINSWTGSQKFPSSVESSRVMLSYWNWNWFLFCTIVEFPLSFTNESIFIKLESLHPRGLISSVSSELNKEQTCRASFQKFLKHQVTASSSDGQIEFLWAGNCIVRKTPLEKGRHILHSL